MGKKFFVGLGILFLLLGAGAGTRGTALASEELDRELGNYIRRFALRPLDPPPQEKKNPDLFLLGKNLFFEKNISGNKNISCASCHRPEKGTGDVLPLSLGEGSEETSSNAGRIQGHSTILRRNSPALYNLSENDFFRPLFWDGRVRYNPRTRRYENPLEGAILSTPEYEEIVKAVSSPLAMQAMFPMINEDEMLGKPGVNDLSNSSGPLEVWEKIVQRVLSIPRYGDLIKNAFPDIRPEKINIGHFATAIAHFTTYNFSAANTPYDRYLRGEKGAMNEQEKRGLKVFLTSGNCLNCHNGPQLSDFIFSNIGIPIIERDGGPFWYDLGRFNVTANEVQDLHKFRTPPLRNIALTGPYMHNGSHETIREVIAHYNNPMEDLTTYVWKDRTGGAYKEKFRLNPRPDLMESLSVLDPRLADRLDLTKEEMDDLEVFLTKSLTNI